MPNLWQCSPRKTFFQHDMKEKKIQILSKLMGLLNTPTAPLPRDKTPLLMNVLYGTKQSDGEVPVILELWEMRRSPSLPLLPGPLWPGMVAPERVPSMG